MPELEIVQDTTRMVGTRRKRDSTLDEAMKTMERFAAWLADTPTHNPWAQANAVEAAMLYGMLEHLRAEIDRLIALGGEDARAAFEFIQSARRNGTPRRGDERAP